jgi:hypothetical protein
VKHALTHRYRVEVERDERRGQFRWHHRRSAPRVVERDVRSRPFVGSVESRSQCPSSSQKTLAELAITDLERTADEYRAMAATAWTAADRDSHTRVADGFERIIERRKQAVPRRLD